MRKKNLLFLTAFAALMASCSNETEMLGDSPGNMDVPADGKFPVGFSAYTNRSVTRAGLTGDLTTAQIQKSKEEGGGFGVFAYYTDLKKYDQTYVPNFMYNQGVFFQGDKWQYTPVMYWPNEYGSDAQSDDEDKVSFFAYAPYVQHASAAAGSVEGEADWGITGFSRNSAHGDPLVKYIASFNPTQTVDLCWGVCDETEWRKIQSGSNYIQQMEKGFPWLNVEHPHGVNQPMTFTFKHALAQLNVVIDADADGVTHAEGQEIDSDTKIWVRSISFTGVALKGCLNLNNTVGGANPEALWLDYSGLTDLPFGEQVTVKDGRRDGREGTSGAEALNETPRGLNDEIVQSDDESRPGVTHTPRNLFNSTVNTNSVYVIPTGEQMTVTIVYDVETKSPSLTGTISDGKTPGISVENKITKKVNFGAGNDGLKPGRKYTLNLHLGMNTVKFDAKVSDWEDNTSVTADEWLPSNLYANAPVSLSLGTSRTMPLKNGTNTLTANTTPTNDEVTWTNTNDDVASISAPAGTRGVQQLVGPKTIVITPKSVGTTVVTATTAHGSSSCTITVVDDNTQKVTVSLDKTEMALYAGQTGAVTATTAPAGQQLTWSSSNGNVATVDPSTGAITTVNSGIARITATTASGETASVNLTVKDTEVILDKTGVTLFIDATEQLTATTNPDGAEVTWTSDHPDVAMVDNTGKITAVAAGTAVVTAAIDGGRQAKCYVTVMPSEAEVVTAPMANGSLTYNGTAQELTTSGSARYGTMVYAVGDSQPSSGSFTSTVPTATNAGTYKVWYYAKGENGFTDSEVRSLTVTIAKKQCEISFESEQINKTVGDAAFTNILTNTGSGKVTYSINCTSEYATINASTGQVTIGTKGNDNIIVTATVVDTENNEYAVKTKTYKLNIAAAAQPTGNGVPGIWGNGGGLSVTPDRDGI